MPIVAIGAAVGSLAIGGASAIGAVVAGTATLATTLTAVATVGAVVGAVGVVAGNEDLMTAGMVLGGIGGIGSLAANAGLFGAEAATASLFGGGAEVAGVATDAFTATVPRIGDVASNLATLPMETVVSTAVAPSVGIVDTLGALTMASTMIPSRAPDPAKDLQIDRPAKTPEAAKIAETSQAEPPWVKQPTAAPKDAAAVTGDIERVSKPADNGPVGGLIDFFKSDKTGATQFGIIQAGGSLISGLFDELEPAQIKAYQAQAELNRVTAAQEQMRLRNMGQSLPVARRVTPAVTGAPATSLINSPVTGAVAA